MCADCRSFAAPHLFAVFEFEFLELRTVEGDGQQGGVVDAGALTLAFEDQLRDPHEALEEEGQLGANVSSGAEDEMRAAVRIHTAKKARDHNSIERKVVQPTRYNEKYSCS